MKKRLFSNLLAAVLCVGLAAGCAKSSSGVASSSKRVSSAVSKEGPGLTVSDAGQDSKADYNVKGTVVMAVNKNRSTDYQALVDTFSKVYKNVDLEVDYFDTSGGSPEYLAAKASAKKLPDIMFDDYASLPFYISQGWVYPLSDFVKNDPDYAYVPQPITKSLTFGGKLYALPDTVHFGTIVLNDDLLDTLNLDHPSLDWTTDDYASLVKAATNSTYSGTETLFDFDTKESGIASPNETILGYNYDTHKFDLTSNWVKMVSFERKLRVIPGVEAWSLRWNNASGNKSDYTTKFGQGDTSDNYMAFKMGKVLSDTDQGTWSAWFNDLKFKWELWPYPQTNGSKTRFPMDVDYSFMTTGVTQDNLAAAQQVLRYFTYSKEGNLARLSMFDAANAGKYVLNNNYYIPATTQPDVAAKFKSLPKVTKAVAYMYDHMSTSFREDPSKIVPGFDDVNNQYILPTRNKVTDGLADPATVAPEIQAKANDAIAKKWADFSTSLSKVQASFDSTHAGWTVSGGK